MRTLADDVRVTRRFSRSVRIGVDAEAGAAEGFVCTATSAQALLTTVEHVSAHKHGAFTWTGPYGCGKSSLAVVLSLVVGPECETRTRALKALPADVRARVLESMRWSPPGWCVVPVVGRRADARELVLQALEEQRIPRGGQDVVEALLAAARRGPGLLLVIDEMGKLLEHAAGGEGDAHFFQDLAEAASRSDGRLVVVGILHQAFDDYAYRLARETRDDWLKIQGRFVDVPLNPSGEEQIELLSRAIEVTDPERRLGVAERVAQEVHGDRVGGPAFAARLSACWPLNPVVACLLGPLSRRRFGQNQRSLFGFLGSAEPFGFQDFLAGTPSGSGAMYDVAWLWSYLRANLEPSILASPDGHRWAVAIDAVERCEARDGGDADLRVLKAIALVDLFRERSGLVASTAILHAALSDLAVGEIEETLDRLRSWSLVVFRRHLGGYSLYAGSDFDIDRAVEESQSQMVGCDYSRLRVTGVLTPILAKRHYHETGAMRWFDVDVATLETAEQQVAGHRFGSGAAGLFLLIVNDGGASAAKVRRDAARLDLTIGGRPIAYAVSGDSYMLRELTLELLALERIQATRPELKGDPVARREVAGRIARLASELEDRLRDALGSVSWHAPALDRPDLAGPRVEGAAGLSLMASRMARALYPATPLVRNELVNRSRPSSNAMAAIRALMTAMVDSGEHERLAISGYPPEAGLYASILQRTGLHVGGTAGVHRFVEPAEDSDPGRLAPLWESGDGLLASAKEGVTMAALFATWRERPFGVKDGLLPVLGLAFMLSRRDRLAIYLDHLFCPAIGDLLVDRMLQDAGSVRMRLSTVSDRDGAILKGIADVVGCYAGETAPADPLAIARQFVSIVMSAPGWTRRTARLGRSALKVRDMAVAANDPNKLLLDDLPKITGPDAAVEAVITVLREGLAELTNAYGGMLADIQGLLVRELRAEQSPDGLHALRVRAGQVVGLTGNYRLDAFATRLASFDGSREGLEGLASLAANKPPRDWVDRDVDAARVELAALAQQFLRGEAFAHVGGRGLERFAIAVYMSDPGRDALVTPEINVDRAAMAQAKGIAGKLLRSIGDDVPRDVAIAAAAELLAGLAEQEPVAEVVSVRKRKEARS